MNAPLFNEAKQIISRLNEAGYESYFCGGCVRDMLLCRDWHDIDIATSATPDEIESLFGAQNVVQCGKNFLVCRVKLQRYHIEVATFRVESGYTDGRHPQHVRKGTLTEDACRRDLTINALYFQPISQTLKDPTNHGLNDLRDGVIRLVGDPEQRLREDYVRILRALRFAAIDDFTIDQSTAKALFANVRLLLSCPMEAIKDELNKGLIGEYVNPSKYLECLYAFNVLKVLIPEVHALRGCEQTPKHHPEGDVFEHVKLMLKNAKDRKQLDVPMAWSILMHDIAKPHTFAINPENGYITNHGHAEVGEPIARRIMGDLRFDNKTIRAVCYVVKNHMKFTQAKQMRKHKLIRLLTHENGGLLLDLHWIDCASSNRLFDNHAYCKEILKTMPAPPQQKPKLPQSVVNGHDLLALGYKRGMHLGVVLREIADKHLDGDINSKEEALEYARTRIDGTGSDRELAG